MFLQEKSHHEMIEILSLSDLFDPFHKTLVGRYQRGEEVRPGPMGTHARHDASIPPDFSLGD